MLGNEKFRFDNQDLNFDIKDFWSFQYSNIYSLHGEIAEFVVARSLGITEAQNSEYWTLWDITYENVKIEVKATAYFHLWNKDGNVSKQRTFSIAKANGSYDAEIAGNSELRRQNDIYVFCLINGETVETANPLDLDNWEFYVVPTAFLDEYCGDNKKISLGRIRSFGFECVRYNNLKNAIDAVIKNIKEIKA